MANALMSEWKLPPYAKKMQMSAGEVAGFTPWGLTALNVPELHKRATGKGIKVAVIDTGIDANHPAFSGAVLQSRNFTNERDAHDGNGHGSHTAGTIGARKRAGINHYGVASDCLLIIGKALDKRGSGDINWINNALQWAYSLKPDLISMSLESPEPDPTMRQILYACKAAGIPVVAAAGNAGPRVGSVGYPAADFDLTFGIAARDDEGHIANFSATEQVGRDGQIDVCAPGVHILSCWPGGGYRYLDGTSMATPHVAGGLALVMQYRKDNGLLPITEFDSLQAALKDTCKFIDGTSSDRQGFGDFNPTGLMDYGVASPTDKRWDGRRFYPITEFLGLTFELAISWTSQKKET